jgi:hypothetical protein
MIEPQTPALDDTQSSAPVRTFHLLSGKASVFAQYVYTYSEGSRGESVAWVVSVMARDSWGSWREHKLPIGTHRKEELERGISMDIRHPAVDGW